jgi:hypothetical protein
MRRLFALLSTSISVFAAIGILLFSIQTAAHVKEKDITFTRPEQTPLVTRMDVPYKIQCGLANKHIAMWASHGKYFESKLNRWEWQRARLFETCEDLYTSSYVLPFLAPMLENAGAYVMMPRERDTQTEEVIVDNDGALDQSVTIFGTQRHRSMGDGQWSRVRPEAHDVSEFRQSFPRRNLPHRQHH